MTGAEKPQSKFYSNGFCEKIKTVFVFFNPHPLLPPRKVDIIRFFFQVKHINDLCVWVIINRTIYDESHYVSSNATSSRPEAEELVQQRSNVVSHIIREHCLEHEDGPGMEEEEHAHHVVCKQYRKRHWHYNEKRIRNFTRRRLLLLLLLSRHNRGYTIERPEKWRFYYRK